MHSATRLTAALTHGVDEPSDAELLTRFAAHRDVGAFELLVWRHNGLVLRVCRDVLGDHHAAEDAAQAVFLALARQAASVGRASSAAGWLFRVARRIAARAARRPRIQSVPGGDLDLIPAPTVATDSDRDGVLHEELARLPEVYSAPLLACFFQGLTHAQAAQRLGWPVGTVAGRVARAKNRLATRLARRGVSLPLLAPIALATSPSFAAATARAAAAFAHNVPEGTPAAIVSLASWEIRMTTARKLLPGVVVAVIAFGCLAFGLRLSAEPPAAPPPRPIPASQVPKQEQKATVVGSTFAVVPITTELQRRLYNGGASSTAVVMVDGSALFKDPKTLDVGALALKDLQKGLAAQRPEKGKSVAHLEVHYGNVVDVAADGREFLDFALQGAVRAVGFVPATAPGFHTYHNAAFAFAEYVAPLKDGSVAGEAEDGVGNAQAVGYRVRTPLSQVLTQSADGVIDVRPALACREDDWLPAEVNKSVTDAIGKLKLAKGQRLNFLLNVTNRDLRTQDRVRAACKRWAEDAGQELWSFSY